MLFTECRNNKWLKFPQLCLGLFIFLSCTGAGSCQTDNELYEAQLENCINQVSKDTKDGIKCLENLRISSPHKGSTYLILARTYRALGRLDKAEEVINTFVYSYKTDASGYSVKCEILRDKRDFQEALLACDKAMSLEPDNLTHKRTIASIYEAQSDFERAENWYLIALKTNSDDQNTLVALGGLYEKTGSLDKAIETYEKLLKQDNFEFKEKLREGIKRLKDQKETQIKKEEEKNKENQKPRKAMSETAAN